MVPAFLFAARRTGQARVKTSALWWARGSR